jgi:hypothetical protein
MFSIALCTSYSLASDDTGADKPRPAPDKKNEDGAASPRALVEKLIDALAEGDAEKVGSCFDTSSEEGKLAAAARGTFAALVKEIEHVLSAAEDKFGREARTLLQQELFETQFLEMARETKKDKDKVEVFLNEKGNKAIIRVPGWREEFQVLIRRDGRWYIMPPTEQKAAGAALAAALFSDVTAKRLEQIPAAIKESDTIEAFRTKVKEIAKSSQDGLKIERNKESTPSR